MGMMSTREFLKAFPQHAARAIAPPLNPPPTKKRRAARGTGRASQKKRDVLADRGREPMAFAIPYPLSTNHLYASTKSGRRVLSKAGKAYKEEVALAAMAKNAKPFAGDVTAVLHLYRAGQHIDVDNIKIVWDALKGFAFYDDRQKRRMTVERFTHTDPVGCAIAFVEPWSAELPNPGRKVPKCEARANAIKKYDKALTLLSSLPSPQPTGAGK